MYKINPVKWSTIYSHFINHFTSQNDKVHLDCPMTLDMAKTISPN